MGSIVERALLPWAQRMRTQVNLPVRLSWGAGGGSSLALGDFEQPMVEIRVRDASALPLLIDPGLDTLGQAYVEGLVDVDGSVADILAVAHRLAETAQPEVGVLGRIRRRFAHTRASDSEAIQYHYDVSNAFYAQWLGEGMVYSCAYFENGDETLDEAQLKKIDHILRKIRLQPGQRLLDIGCGWGALVLRAAQRLGAQCVGVTLSQNQFDLARERVAAAGLQDRVDIRLQDYRDVQDAPFDRITSVGMFEHVGLEHLVGYFGHIRRLLKPDGWVMNHGITSTDAFDGETSLGGGHFIDRYVFPRGELPHISTVLRTLQEGGLEAFDVENLRRHYQRTTQLWSAAFEAHSAGIRPLVDEKRWRIWRIYLAGCAWAFENDEVALYQVLCRPSGQAAAGLPWSRGWMYDQPLDR
ncbi:MAG TPA: SAM-dependent methyltransferase [Hydrogenophaga sp.]|uniref:SAM-dependent methyltransferase n=1 Tax=Hydrogenophaga sp. TaxID=1904254 RepID=UPI0008D31878|nr:cyclopropane-fatty-acyl-phospholipid synthase family protein [Hydrogenophaga sp.]OGA74850.1 MAG: cyclopropane-fatty-acyl-phospholipid synthase [Burkholderiales bacterium GWE1_65_30]OGA90753.1 MAG: cyclopropane-fatty-acyl-phospholipid synthase [Burkholderiales bacterium GWF1_66_17]HAX21588.1 SAM-dependent methyltransferase [Hydrogenophaga sp.]HBU17250.1 SAM-dependent methyltransferase [Hydrogenophaga sp.]